MVAVTALPRARALTQADLAATPDDGHRYELIDGSLVVTPAPSLRHQLVLAGLNAVLRDAVPPDLRVLFAPADVVLAEDSVLQPDLFVARRSDLGGRDLRVPPLLAVEVLSPSTRAIDLHLKRARYETAGSPGYWVVDPDLPAITAWELQAGRYREVAHVEGGQEFTAREPFPVTVVPAKLLD